MSILSDRRDRYDIDIKSEKECISQQRCNPIQGGNIFPRQLNILQNNKEIAKTTCNNVTGHNNIFEHTIINVREFELVLLKLNNPALINLTNNCKFTKTLNHCHRLPGCPFEAGLSALYSITYIARL